MLNLLGLLVEDIHNLNSIVNIEEAANVFWFQIQPILAFHD